MKQLVAVLAGLAAFVAAEAGTSSSTAVEARSCAQRADFFNVELLGDKDATRWTSASSRPLGSVPDQKTVAVVWSLGGPAATSGMAVYAWITSTGFRFASGCTRTRAARKHTTRGLRAPLRVKDGWNLGRRFACLQPGRLVMAVRDVPGGKRMTVRMERTGQVVAVADATRGGGSIRGSTRCERRS